MRHQIATVLFALIFSASLSTTAEATTSESEHDHEEHELWEQAAVYSLDAGDNTAQIDLADGVSSSEGASFAFMIVPTSSADSEGLEEAEEDAEAAWELYSEGELDPVVLSSGGSASPNASIVYSVSLDSVPVDLVIPIADDGAYAFFLEHGEEETSFVVSSPSGEVLEAAAEEHSEEHDEHDHEDEEEEDEDEAETASGTQWAYAIIASLLVSSCSLVGIALATSQRISEKIDLSNACMLAAGALLVTTFIHIVPEAMEGLAEEHGDDLHTIGNRVGVAMLGGILFCVLVHGALAVGHRHHSRSATDGGHEGGENYEGANLGSIVSASRNKRLLDLEGLQPVCWNVILGDFVHNFADGVTIGAAFLSCSSTIGWVVTASTILHEVPHEVADFMALIKGGMSFTQACVWNLLSALSCILGVVVVLALRGELTDAGVAYLLLVGGGAFLFIALAELMPDALEAGPSKGAAPTGMQQLQKIVWFIIGAVVIGITFLWDEHCSEGGHSHDH